MSLIVNGSTGSIIGTLPAGMVMYFANSTAPQGWFQCDGSAKSRTNYPELFTAIGTTYGTGDGATTFNLPDFRGQFLRGWATATTTLTSVTGTISAGPPFSSAGNILTVNTVVPTVQLRVGQVISGGSLAAAAGTVIINQLGGTTGGIGTYTVSGDAQLAYGAFTVSVPDAGRAFGSSQYDLLRSHSHTIDSPRIPTGGVIGGNTNTPAAAPAGAPTSTITATGGIETRPVNTAIMICIKY